MAKITVALSRLFMLAILVSLGACSTPKKIVDPDNKVGVTAEQQEQFDLAISAMRNNLYHDAKPILTQLMIDAPLLSGPPLNLGIIALHEKKYVVAKDHFLNATTINPENATAYQYLGLAHRELGEFLLAEQAYLHAIDLAGEYSVAHRNLGILYDLYLHDLVKAKEQYELYQQSIPEPDKTVDIWLQDLTRRIESSGK